jgi:hypothetical protein
MKTRKEKEFAQMLDAGKNPIQITLNANFI